MYSRRIWRWKPCRAQKLFVWHSAQMRREILPLPFCTSELFFFFSSFCWLKLPGVRHLEENGSLSLLLSVCDGHTYVSSASRANPAPACMWNTHVGGEIPPGCPAKTGKQTHAPVQMVSPGFVQWMSMLSLATPEASQKPWPSNVLCACVCVQIPETVRILNVWMV